MRPSLKLLLILAVFAAGCAAQSRNSSSSQPAVNLSGYSPAFRHGYNDGCDSARASLRRNEKRYLGDSDYKMGWNDGHSVCQRKQMLMR